MFRQKSKLVRTALEEYHTALLSYVEAGDYAGLNYEAARCRMTRVPDHTLLRAVNASLRHLDTFIGEEHTKNSMRRAKTKRTRLLQLREEVRRRITCKRSVIKKQF